MAATQNLDTPGFWIATVDTGISRGLESMANCTCGVRLSMMICDLFNLMAALINASVATTDAARANAILPLIYRPSRRHSA